MSPVTWNFWADLIFYFLIFLFVDFYMNSCNTLGNMLSEQQHHQVIKIFVFVCAFIYVCVFVYEWFWGHSQLIFSRKIYEFVPVDLILVKFHVMSLCKIWVFGYNSLSYLYFHQKSRRYLKEHCCSFIKIKAEPKRLF